MPRATVVNHSCKAPFQRARCRNHKHRPTSMRSAPSRSRILEPCMYVCETSAITNTWSLSNTGSPILTAAERQQTHRARHVTCAARQYCFGRAQCVVLAVLVARQDHEGTVGVPKGVKLEHDVVLASHGHLPRACTQPLARLDVQELGSTAYAARAAATRQCSRRGRHCVGWGSLHCVPWLTWTLVPNVTGRAWTRRLVWRFCLCSCTAATHSLALSTSGWSASSASAVTAE